MAMDTQTTPPGELPPLKNGTRRNANGRFISGPDKSAPNNGMITPDNARDMVARRQAMARDAFAAGIVRTMVNTGQAKIHEGEAGAWQAVAEKATTLLLDSDDAGRFARLLKTTAELAGYAPTRQAEQQQAGVADLFAAVPAGGLVMLVKRLQADDQPGSTRADVLDVDGRDDDHPTP